MWVLGKVSHEVLEAHGLGLEVTNISPLQQLWFWLNNLRWFPPFTYWCHATGHGCSRQTGLFPLHEVGDVAMDGQLDLLS